MRKRRLFAICPEINFRVFTAFAALFLALAASGQTPPPNDNYSNSVTLTGTDITFSGTLAGATIEDSQETIAASNMLYVAPTQSVWWNWTAPTDTVLTLEIVSTSFHPTEPPSPYTVYSDALIIYGVTNGSTTPDGLVQPPVALMLTAPLVAPQTISIPVTGGSNYELQLIGNSSANYTFRLVSTDTPAIITQPRSQTVDSNDCALFYVVYAGIGQSNFTFQWYFNGTNLPGETTPMLALTNIDSTMAGIYTVAVSNSAGATLSAPATLTVSQSNFPVSLSAVGFATTNFTSSFVYFSNAFVFSMAGEVGRSYRLQSSTDMTNWTSESDYPISPDDGNLTSIFYQTNASQILAVPYTNSAQEFYRAIPYVLANPDTAVCVNNLRKIRIAKFLWQRDYNPWIFATPQTSDIIGYFPYQELPSCPADWEPSFADYWINNLLTEPQCVYDPIHHFLEDPR